MGNNGVGGGNADSRELDDVVSEAEPPVVSGTEAITHTFSLVKQAGDRPVAYFYGRLFAGNPELRPMFPAAMGAQRDRLFHALTRIVHSLSTPEEMEPYLSQLGLDHRKYGVLTEHYPAIGRALLATLCRFSGDAWSPGAEAAWAGAYERATQLMIAAADESAEHSPAWWSAEVVGHELRSPTLAVLTLRPEEPFPYLAGQYVSIQSAHWHRVWRPFSVANAPRADGLLTFHVRAVPGGWVSSALVHHTNVGDRVNLGPPQGTMTLAAASDQGMFCVAGGSGLAPLKALIEQAIADTQPDRRRRIRLIVGARRESELYDLSDLWRLESYYPWLRSAPRCQTIRITPGSRECSRISSPASSRKKMTMSTSADLHLWWKIAPRCCVPQGSIIGVFTRTWPILPASYGRAQSRILSVMSARACSCT